MTINLQILDDDDDDDDDGDGDGDGDDNGGGDGDGQDDPFQSGWLEQSGLPAPPLKT